MAFPKTLGSPQMSFCSSGEFLPASAPPSCVGISAPGADVQGTAKGMFKVRERKHEKITQG